MRSEFQSTLPVGGATSFFCFALPRLCISIHAPRGGSDPTLLAELTIPLLFQSTLPVGGATQGKTLLPFILDDFNPRSPWGERHRCNISRRTDTDFNPRSPWGERLGTNSLHDLLKNISIHAPRGGSDPH